MPLFGIDWPSDCTPLAEKAQELAEAVYDECANRLNQPDEVTQPGAIFP
jgi:hypothetical protein